MCEFNFCVILLNCWNCRTPCFSCSQPTKWNFEHFLNIHPPAYRGVYDFADPDSSVFVIATGQSGNPLSRHYDDLGELWRRGEYIPMSLDPELARAGNIGITRLAPR